MSQDSDQVFPPGETVPVGGIYVCDCRQHQKYSTDVTGHRFPPLHDNCTGSGWQLRAPAAPRF
ncbi:hypothetical protein GCM10010129_70630 [Streptomyces fumigatiscleroticus]|nr:hypothetical protein GCM10010129_70630 [Streptomyces fumigatiscleroticus]